MYKSSVLSKDKTPFSILYAMHDFVGASSILYIGEKNDFVTPCLKFFPSGRAFSKRCAQRNSHCKVVIALCLQSRNNKLEKNDIENK